MNALTIAFVGITMAVSTMGEIDKEGLMKIGRKCMEESHSTEEEMNKLLKMEAPTTQPAKCLLACVFKTLGVLNDKGLYQEQVCMKLAEEMFKGNPDNIEKAKTLTNACKVQMNNVVDDEKGCERAATGFACKVEKAKEYGYKLDV